MPKKYTDPLSILQAQTLGMVTTYHQGKLSDDELTVAIGEELEKARQSVRESIGRNRVPEPKSAWDYAENEAIDRVLKELGLDK